MKLNGEFSEESLVLEGKHSDAWRKMQREKLWEGESGQSSGLWIWVIPIGPNTVNFQC